MVHRIYHGRALPLDLEIKQVHRKHFVKGACAREMCFPSPPDPGVRGELVALESAPNPSENLGAGTSHAQGSDEVLVARVT
eukprot:2038295-Pyramimonas_sp.AAC.2